MSNPLIIENVQGKIATLERRIEHLQRRLESPAYQQSTSAEFDRAEVAALRDAVRAMRYHADGVVVGR